METDQQLFHTILGSYKNLEHLEIPKHVFLQFLYTFPGSNTDQEHLSLPMHNDRQLFHTIIRSCIYLLHIERNTFSYQ